MGPGDEQAILEPAVLRPRGIALEHLALPAEDVNEMRDWLGHLGARSDDGSALPFADRNLARRNGAKHLVELVVRQLREIVRLREGRRLRESRVGRHEISG